MEVLTKKGQQGESLWPMARMTSRAQKEGLGPSSGRQEWPLFLVSSLNKDDIL